MPRKATISDAVKGLSQSELRAGEGGEERKGLKGLFNQTQFREKESRGGESQDPAAIMTYIT